MILLDTDHLSVLKYPDSAGCARLMERLKAAGDPGIGTTVVCVEEQMRGWLAEIARMRQPRRQIRPYQDLLDLLAFLGDWTVLPFDARAADEFERQRSTVRIGAMDLKIASIVLIHQACFSPPTAGTSSKSPACAWKTGCTRSVTPPRSSCTPRPR